MALSRRARSHRGLSSCAISDFVLSGGASVSIRANLLGVRRKGDRALWHYTWRVDCPQSPYEMQAARWLGLGSVTSDALRKRS